MSLPTTDQTLHRKVAIVTGAGRGIGHTIAMAYARAGAAVCCAARTATELEATVQAITAAGGQALAVPTDVSQLAAVQHMVQTTVATFGGLDILVINAGVNPDRRSIEDSNPAAWQVTLEVNLLGAYYCAHAAIPALKQRGAGKIITIGSGLGHRSPAGNAAYACSKAGLWMLTRVLAQELWPYNISVNELIPGPVLTSMDGQLASQRQGVFGIDSEWVKTPEEVVPLALFLATQPTIGPTAQSFSLMRRDT
jgi:NAD(P)-dependent dehydrogenase (short-subunit alcohol dehydrogenase family)